MKATLDAADFRLMLDSISDGLFVMDHDWNLSYLNRRAEDVLGVKAEQLLGRNIWQSFPEAVDSIFYERYHQAVRERRMVEFEAYFAPLKAWLAIRAYPQSYGLLVLFMDVTLRRQDQARLQTREAHYHQLFTRHPAPMWIYDPTSLRILEVNDAAVVRYGYPREQFLRLTLLDLRPSEDREKLLNFRPEAGDLVTSGPWLHRDAHGGIFPVEISRHVIEFEGRQAHVVMAQDISERVEAEADARFALERFRSVARVNSDVIWDRDLEANTIWWSEGFQTQFGYSAEEVQPTLEFWGALVHPDDVDRVSKSLQDAIDRSQHTWRDQYRFRLKGGGYAEIEDRGSLLFDEHGHPIRMVGGMSDITLQKNAQRERQERERFFRLSVELLAIADLDGTIRQISPAFTRILGYQTEELLHRDFMEFIHPDDVLASRQELSQLGPNAADSIFVNRWLCKDGSYKWIEWSTALGDDRRLYAAGRDVSARVVAEQNLRQTFTQLKQRNTELQEFAFVASHDLKEPLRKILAFSERLASQASDQLDSNGLFFLQRLTHAAHRMDALLDALLAYSRLSGKMPQVAPVHLGKLISEVCDDLVTQAEAAGAQIQCAPVMPEVEADAQQLRQVFQNLISNALKFRSPQRPLVVLVRARLAPQTVPPCVEITVEDNGIGFDPQYAEQIFSPFQRLHSLQAYEGSGIGLAIVRRIVEQHGGNIVAHGMPGQGARFEIMLPVHARITDRVRSGEST